MWYNIKGWWQPGHQWESFSLYYLHCDVTKLRVTDQRLARNFKKSDESGNADYRWLKVTESYPIEFVSHVFYSLLLIGIHVIAQ